MYQGSETNLTFRRCQLRSVPTLFLFAMLAVSPAAARAQSPEPVREQLLNGLNIFLWPRPGDPNVVLKLRINSGAAFDLAGKNGLMALLADALFPDPNTREYVTEQLGGKLEVETTHDAIEVTISGKAGEFERMVELLRNAVLSMQLSPEHVARLRDEKIKQLSANDLAAAEIADRAIAQRLFGRFPYAHFPSGTSETVTKIERADLMLARERFLNADNAALAIVGGVEKARAMRALRQLLGPWNKADRTVPASFRQPEPPDKRVLVLNQPNATAAEIRLAVRGLTRSDRDAPLATLILTRIIRDRWRAARPDLSLVSVRHEAHTLPGTFVMAATSPTASAGNAVTAARQIILALAQSSPTAAELERARSEALNEVSQRLSQTESITDAWLDTVTFRASAPSSLVDSINKMTAADVQRVASRLFKDASVAAVVVGNSQELKTAFADPVELRDSAHDANSSSTSTAPTKKP